MARRAILIEASGKPGEKGYLEGAVADVENFRIHLLSEHGGAWETSEVTVLHNPSRSQVLTEIAAAKTADYSFVTASGHGYHLKSGTLSETMFCLKDNDEIGASELNTGSPRCTVVLDCCRKITSPAQLQEMRKSVRAALAAKAPRSFYRRAFDDALLASEKGCSYLYSCDLDEAAQEDNNGGFYSVGLVFCARAWHDVQSSAGIYDVVDAHNGAAKVVTAREPQQHPKHQAGRRLRYFPFAVSP